MEINTINTSRLVWFNSHWFAFSKRATRWRAGGFPILFSENRKSCPDFGKKGANSVHLWVKYSIQNVNVRVSKRKNSKIFPAASFFLVLLTKLLSKCPNAAKSSPTIKNFWLRT